MFRGDIYAQRPFNGLKSVGLPVGSYGCRIGVVLGFRFGVCRLVRMAGVFPENATDGAHVLAHGRGGEDCGKIRGI